ncbi:MAG: GlxA family transcriptional regulator [Solirubrobacteraceae bacterium]
MHGASSRVVLVAFDGAQVLDITGPSEVFAIAERIVRGSYAVEVVSVDGAEIRTSGGVRLLADRSTLRSRGRIDTLIVAGGLGVRAALDDGRLIGWLRVAAARSRRVASVCTGAFLLAEAGLLDGRRACTHWAACAALAERYPKVEVEADPIYISDGGVWTSAGISAGIDLALALVEDDLGTDVALEVARMLVLFLHRPGGQAQFSSSLAVQTARSEPLRELQAWIADHLAADLSVTALAGRVFMSQRHFARVFAEQIGVTPARYVQSLRVERAKLLLQSGDRTPGEIAAACGFGTVETMRRAFVRATRVNPGVYRERFRSPSRAPVPT